MATTRRGANTPGTNNGPPVVKRRRPTLAEKSAAGQARMNEAEQAKKDVLAAEGYEELFEPTVVANSLWRQFDPKSLFNQRTISGPEELWERAQAYFIWAEQNPLREAKVFSTQKGLKKAAIPKMRAFTVEGLCVFLGITRDTWMMWGRKEVHPDLADSVKVLGELIREQKFSGAAADLLNATIISRDLGLADRQELSGPDGGPMEVSPRDLLAERLARLAETREATADPTPEIPTKVKKAQNPT